MARPRPPAWFFLVAASFAVYMGLVAYGTVYPPAPVGVTVLLQNGHYVISSVTPGSPADRGGLRKEDRIVGISGWPMMSPTSRVIRILTTAPDLPQAFAVLRDGQPVTLQVASQGRELVNPFNSRLELLMLLVDAFSVGLGLFVMSRAPARFAGLGGLLLCSLGALPLSLPRGLLAVWRGLPQPVAWLAWPALFSGFLLPLTFFVFCATFPRRLIPRWLIAAVALVWLPFIARMSKFMLDVLADPAARPMLSTGFLIGSGVLDLISVGGGALLLAFAPGRLTDANERRRVRVLHFGIAAAALGLLHAVADLIGASIPSLRAVTWVIDWVHPIVPLVLALLPITFAYAILRHRLFDVSVIVRQGLQYATARGLLLSIAPVAAAALVLDLLWHGTEPLVNILRARGWVYAAVIAATAVAHVNRGRWMAALDRRFFRDRYESERLLREVAEDVRRAPSFEAAARDVAQRVERALHPEFVALFTRSANATTFSTLICIPSGRQLALARDSKIAGLMRVLGAPVDLSTGSAMAEQLRPADVQDLQHEGVDLLVPIVTGLTSREAILVLGRKKSEEPYSRQDRELLAAVASNLAVLLERAGGAPAIAVLPSLTPRYTLVQRLGEGGMGTVYEALDTELQRTVAIKVIRDDAVADPAFAQRFRQEAMSAAAFAHPNVVSIHDFSVSPDGRMFIVMERLTGKTLREELRTRGHFTPTDAAPILNGVCAAADAAHRRQIVHRDLKPENVFLVRDGSLQTVKVVDFGIARSLGPVAATAVTGTGQIVGTIQYMAPEQVGGAKATGSADLWAIAVIAYEMLSGRHPFADETGFQWSRAALGRFSPLDGDLARFSDFFARAFAAHPSVRYPDAAALEEGFAASRS